MRQRDKESTEAKARESTEAKARKLKIESITFRNFMFIMLKASFHINDSARAGLLKSSTHFNFQLRRLGRTCLCL